MVCGVLFFNMGSPATEEGQAPGYVAFGWRGLSRGKASEWSLSTDCNYVATKVLDDIVIFVFQPKSFMQYEKG